MKKVYILALLALMGQSSWAQIREFQTTRLNSTAGAGVASILSTEAAVLNPAASTYFQGSSFSYQSYSTSLRRENSSRNTNTDDFPKRNKSEGFFMSDHSGPLKGGMAYLQQRENNYYREQILLHGSAPMGPRSSLGVSYNYIQDKRPADLSPRHQVHHQSRIGTIHIIDEKTTLGLVIIDPTRTTPGEERVIAGFQYMLADRLTLMGDAGAQYSQAYDKKYLWRAAVQINVFSDFFLRAGRFHDNILEMKGTGWGASWIGPRLGIEFAQKISDQFGQDQYIYKNEQLVDTSISAIIKF